MSMYERWSEAVRAGEPIALVTVVDGPGTGSKLLVEPGVAAQGTFPATMAGNQGGTPKPAGAGRRRGGRAARAG